VAKTGISRRKLLKLSAAAGGAALLAACTTETRLSRRRRASAAASASAAPTGRTAAGKYPLGKLEGPIIVTDAAKFPKTSRRRPSSLRSCSRASYPPVAQRIGQDPLVIQAAHHRQVRRPRCTRRSSAPGTKRPVDLALHDRRRPAPAVGLRVEDDQAEHRAELHGVARTTRRFTVQLRRGMKWVEWRSVHRRRHHLLEG
jgi:hypothetical protein